MTDHAPTHSQSRSRAPITDSKIEALASEAEAGYDVDRLIARRRKHGQPALGSSPASVESVPLDPELRSELLQRSFRRHDALGGHQGGAATIPAGRLSSRGGRCCAPSRCDPRREPPVPASSLT